MNHDVIVVGGGHAGCEAAAAAARMGARTILLTMDAATVGAMSCNPAIGGVGKGHLVREIDVFDGIIARAADASAIHYRMLNCSKGAAVHGPRIQADRARFRDAVQATLRAQGVELAVGEAAALESRSGSVSAIRLADGRRLSAPSIVLATGTFLGGRLFQGRTSRDGGRVDEPASRPLASVLREIAPVVRLKTGTPPRLDGRTIDWSRLQIQSSDADDWTMSPLGRRTMPQLFCAITRTNERTHDLIRAASDLSPLYAGDIEGAGPRYCPSIEDKVRRFGDRDGHQLFLEPEGVDDGTIYPNGLSTSLPPDVQQRLIGSIDGLQDARIVVPGYAVEYDHVDPRSLNATLELRALPGLFLAGQINGTTGYEEAAGQGLVAGLNAAARALDRPPQLFRRWQSYLGVMVDDLVLQGVTEPYRMLTARAEHRLSLRADNAEQRLGQTALAAGVVGAERAAGLAERDAQRQAARDGREDGVAPDILAEVEADLRYAPYVERLRLERERIARNDGVPIPGDTRFETIGGLSTEMIERLDRSRPDTIGEAGRIRGITPAAVAAILVHVRKRAA